MAVTGSFTAMPHLPGAEPERAIDRLLLRAAQEGASDLLLAAGSRPHLRVEGSLRVLTDLEPVTTAMLTADLQGITPESVYKQFKERGDADFNYEIKGVLRFRVNLYRDRRGPSAVLRLVPFEIPTVEQIGLPQSALSLCRHARGLVLITGARGSGKSTTLAALVDYINRERAAHVISLERPIEFAHENKRSLVQQRQVPEHTRSYSAALRAALREDPDVVTVSNLRDPETAALAIGTAETDLLAFGILHATSAAAAIDRLLGVFPADRHEGMRQVLAESLRGVIAQSLCQTVVGGRVAAFEVLLATEAVSQLILENQTYLLPPLMQTSRAEGMLTMNDSLVHLVQQGLITSEQAYDRAVQRAELREMLASAGHPLPSAR